MSTNKSQFLKDPVIVKRMDREDYQLQIGYGRSASTAIRFEEVAEQERDIALDFGEKAWKKAFGDLGLDPNLATDRKAPELVADLFAKAYYMEREDAVKHNIPIIPDDAAENT